MLGMAPRNSNNKVANSLVAMSSAAVLAVYAVGYVRTQSAADRMETQSQERRPLPRVPERPASDAAPILRVTSPGPVAPDFPSEKPPAIAVARIEPATKIPKTAEPTATELPLPAAAPAVHPPPVVLAEPVLAAPPQPTPPPPAPMWKDGTYTGWGTSRHGDIQASVVIQSGRIASATIAQCLTRYSCDVIEKLPPQGAQRQSPEVDYVSGATQSTNAFYYAVVEALNKAK